MRKPIAVAFGIVVLTAFAGCTYTSTDTTPAAVTLSAGFDAGEFSTAVRAQDDFYDYINAKWIAANDIPADRSRYGVFNVVFDRTESQVRSLIEAAARQVEQGTAEADEARIGSAYLSFMDEARVESLGILPIADLVSRIDGINTHQQLAGLLGELQLLDISLPVVYYVDGDAADPTRSLAYFWQGGLGLPDRDYYTNDGEKFAAIRAAYLKHIQAMY